MISVYHFHTTEPPTDRISCLHTTIRCSTARRSKVQHIVQNTEGGALQLHHVNAAMKCLLGKTVSWQPTASSSFHHTVALGEGRSRVRFQLRWFFFEVSDSPRGKRVNVSKESSRLSLFVVS